MKYSFSLVVRFVLFTLLFFVLSRANINGVIFPFAFAMFFALAWANQKVWLLSPAYVLGYIATFTTFEGIINATVTVSMLVIPYYIHYAIKKPMKKYELFVYALFSQFSVLLFAVLNNGTYYYVLISMTVGLVLLFAFISIFEPIIIRGFTCKLTLFELVCAGVIILSIANGLASCDIHEFSFLKLFVAFMLLMISSSSSTMAFSFASLSALGSLLRANNPLFFAPFLLWTVAVIIFKGQHKIFSAFALIDIEIAITYYFRLYYSTYFLTYLTVVIACVLFMIVPKKFFDSISSLVGGTNRMAIKNVVNRNRDILSRKLGNLSEVFFEMNHVFKSLIKKGMNSEEIKEMLYQEVKNDICASCPEFNRCHRTFDGETKNLFNELIMIALEKGKVTLLDFPSYLTSRCGKLNYLIGEINTLTSQYKSYSSLVQNVDTSKLLISDQLEGISDIMKSLSSEVDSTISFDNVRETKLIDALSSNNIICTDALIYEKDARTTMATLIVRDEDVDKTKLTKLASKICGGQMSISEVLPTERPGLVNVNLKTAPRYDCIFGLANETRAGNTISGDSHSFVRLDGDKFMFAICDGMGNGEKAGQKSQTAISLIENFYKAGFSNEIILSSVNRLLNLEKDDIFSSIDVCVVDLRSGIADFIKMGSASSFVRGKEGCSIIESGALPIGIVDNAKPLTKKIVLSEKDYIILVSDGVCDTFASDKDFKDFVLSIKLANPQEFADEIIKQALANNNGYAVDDMTCFVVKIF